MRERVVSELRAIVGADAVLTDPVKKLPYECDGLTLEQLVPELVLLPRDTEQCVQIVRVLARERIPIVPRGAGTGLSGGARPVPGGALIGTARMRDVIEVNARDRWARVQAGVVNVELSRAVAPHGLFYAPDPSSQGACTIGGNVAENSGGPHCFRYGATTRHVLGLKLVACDGELVDLSWPEVDPAGYDLCGYVTGSEGMVALVTEVTIRLTPLPETVETVLGIFHSLDAACDSVSEMIAARLDPSAIEILDRLTIEAVEASVFAAGYPKGAEAVLLVEFEGGALDVEDTVRDVEAILRRRGAFELRRARNEKERKQLWAGR